MIKKFNEFVNEAHLQTHQKIRTTQENKQLKYILTEIFGENNCTALIRRIKYDYSFEEIINLLRRLKVNYSSNQMCSYLKILLDEYIESEEKQKTLKEIESKYNKGKSLPIVIDDYTGKLLTGIVWYCEKLDKYAENEDDFNDEGFEYLANYAYEEGYTDDGGVEYAEDNWEDLEIYEIDLDKECDWTDNGRWSELFDEFVNEGFVNDILSGIDTGIKGYKASRNAKKPDDYELDRILTGDKDVDEKTQLSILLKQLLERSAWLAGDFKYDEINVDGRNEITIRRLVKIEEIINKIKELLK